MTLKGNVFFFISGFLIRYNNESDNKNIDKMS